MNDLISRRAAIKAIDDLPNCYNGYSDTYDKAYIIGVLEEVPTIEPKRGRWEDVEADEGEWICFKCSVCGHDADSYTGEIISNEWRFCPYCGAEMYWSEE